MKPHPANLGVVLAKVFGKPSYKAANGKAHAERWHERVMR